MTAEHGVGAAIDQRLPDGNHFIGRLVGIIELPINGDEHEIGMRPSVGDPRGKSFAPLLWIVDWNEEIACLIIVGGEIFYHAVDIEECNDEIVCLDEDRL